MDAPRSLDCLAADYARLRAVAPAGLAAQVPTCPGWTGADLIRHVGHVYLHKAVAMREGAPPDPWPPGEIAQEDPLALLDRAYAALTAEFAGRRAGDPTWTWYRPDQTVGFWIRRMAQETVIHRIDAELAAGQPVAPVPDDLAIDGIDELLRTIVTYYVAEWPEDFADVLDGSPGRTFLLRAGGAAWRARSGPGRFDVSDVAGADGPADVVVSGSPQALLRWAWSRASDGMPGGVTVDGAQDAVAELRGCITGATQ